MPLHMEYVKPGGLAEAVSLLRQDDACALAGGTDVVVQMREGKLRPRLVVDIKGLAELQGITGQSGGVWVGALVTMAEIVKSPLLQAYRAVVQGAGCMGCCEIRHRATIGGNVGNASPSGDAAVPLLVFHPQVVIHGPGGQRHLPLANFFRGAGKTVLQPGELIKGFLLPPPPAFSLYMRHTRVKGMDLAGVSLAAAIDRQGQVTVSMGAVAPTPTRFPQVEELLSGRPLSWEVIAQAAEVLSAAITPRATSLRATPAYKKEMAKVFLHTALSRALEEGFGQ